MKSFLVPATIAAATLAACAAMGDAGSTAVAELSPTNGNMAKGTVTFTQQGDMVRVNAHLSGLRPGAQHAFHVHEKGDCSSGDGMSAGGHFNPAGAPHGPQSGVHHAGDMPNVQADEYGNANATFELHGVSVGSGPNDIVGHGLIVHRDADDYQSQPAGNAGPRIACAVIRRS